MKKTTTPERLACPACGATTFTEECRQNTFQDGVGVLSDGTTVGGEAVELGEVIETRGWLCACGAFLNLRDGRLVDVNGKPRRAAGG